MERRSMSALVAAAAMMAVSSPIASYSAAMQREAIMPQKLPSKRREVHKRKNTMPAKRRVSHSTKLGRRLRRKFELGRNGAF